MKLKFFLSEFLHDYFTVDSKVYRTLYFLIAKPGMLTIEFCEGERVRHIQPFRLFLFISFSYFFLLSITIDDDSFSDSFEIDQAGSLDVSPETDELTILSMEFSDSTLADLQTDTLNAGDSEILKWIVARSEHVSSNPGAFVKGLFRAGSYAVFFLLPLFAVF